MDEQSNTYKWSCHTHISKIDTTHPSMKKTRQYTTRQTNNTRLVCCLDTLRVLAHILKRWVYLHILKRCVPGHTTRTQRGSMRIVTQRVIVSGVSWYTWRDVCQRQWGLEETMRIVTQRGSQGNIRHGKQTTHVLYNKQHACCMLYNTRVVCCLVVAYVPLLPWETQHTTRQMYVCCDVTHSNVCRDSFTCVPRRVSYVALTLCVSRHTYAWVTAHMWMSHVTTHIRLPCRMLSLSRQHSRHMCVVTSTHPCVWRDSSICVPWLIHVCAITHAYVCCLSQGNTATYDMANVCVLWRDSFICVPWLIHKCAMTRRVSRQHTTRRARVHIFNLRHGKHEEHLVWVVSINIRRIFALCLSIDTTHTTHDTRVASLRCVYR